MAAPEQLMASQKELILHIERIINNTKRFEYQVLPVLLNYAKTVHLLPASESHHHRMPGGLFRHGLECAAFAIQYGDTTIYEPNASPSRRIALNERWPIAVMAAALLHDIGKPILDIKVVSADGEFQWNPFESDLYTWGRSRGIQEYHYQWRPDRTHKTHESVSLLYFDRMLGQNLLTWMAEPGMELLRDVSTTLNGTNAESKLKEIVVKSDKKSVTRDLKIAGTGESGAATPIERYLVDALRDLVRTKTLSVNKPGSPVWIIDGSAFVVWPETCEIMLAHIRKQSIPGIPQNPDTICEILGDRGLASPGNRKDGSKTMYWMVRPKVLTDKKPDTKLACLCFAQSELLFDVPPANAPGFADPYPANYNYESVDEVADAPNPPQEDHPQAEQAPSQDGQEEPPPVEAPAPPDQSHWGSDSEDSALGGGIISMQFDPDAPVQEMVATHSPNKPQKSQKPKSVSTPTPVQFDETYEFSEPAPDPINLEAPGPAQSSAPTPSSKANRSKPLPQSDLPDRANATKELRESGMDGEVALYIAQDLKSDKADMYAFTSGRLFLQYPNGLDGYGYDPQELVKRFKQRNWIESDPMQPGEYLRLDGGFREAIAFYPDLSLKLLVIAGIDHGIQPPARQVQQPDSEETVTLELVKPPKVRAVDVPPSTPPDPIPIRPAVDTPAPAECVPVQASLLPEAEDEIEIAPAKANRAKSSKNKSRKVRSLNRDTMRALLKEAIQTYSLEGESHNSGVYVPLAALLSALRDSTGYGNNKIRNALDKQLNLTFHGEDQIVIPHAFFKVDQS